MLHQMAVNAPAYSFKNGKQSAELTKFISKVFLQLHFHWWEENLQGKKNRLSILYVKLKV